MRGEVLSRVYLHGHIGTALPRRLCRLVAQSEIHRAWLSGFDGNFVENGVQYGTSNPYNETPLRRRAPKARAMP